MIEKVAKKIFEMQDKKKGAPTHADTIIRNHVVWSMGAGMIPVLIADIFAVSAIQLDMIRQMSKIYDLEFNELQGKAIVTSLTSSALARLAAGSVVKLIPGLGSLIGGATVSAFAGASTYALGEVFKKHFESGGTILDFDPDRVRQLYKEKFEKGKDIVKDWKKEEEMKEKTTEEGGFVIKDDTPEKEEIKTSSKADAKKESTTNIESKVKTEESIVPSMEKDVLAKLKELGELKKAKIITETEFKKLKKKILENLQ